MLTDRRESCGDRPRGVTGELWWNMVAVAHGTLQGEEKALDLPRFSKVTADGLSTHY